MEVKIGIQHAPRELVIDTDESTENLEKMITEAVSGEGVIALTDKKGRRIVVPAGKVAYVEMGASAPGFPGFRS